MTKHIFVETKTGEEITFTHTQLFQLLKGLGSYLAFYEREGFCLFANKVDIDYYYACFNEFLASFNEAREKKGQSLLSAEYFKVI